MDQYLYYLYDELNQGGSDIPKRMRLFLEPCIGVKNCEKRRQNHRYHPKPQSFDETFLPFLGELDNLEKIL